jgi:hypothetical protein
MKAAPAILLCCFAATCVNANAEDAEAYMDRVDETLSGSAWNDTLRARLSGTIDLENYVFNSPPPGLIYSDRDHVFNPRLNLFFDGQLGSHFYVFAQARADQGFDPGEGDLRLRMDEYAIRITPWTNGVLNLQIGKFGTVVGNWLPRHHSWSNPFVTAPLPYDNLTGIFDAAAAGSAGTLLNWANLGTNPNFSGEYPAQLRVPIIWGPSYSSGAALTGLWGKFDYAIEMKNTSLSSRPEAWDVAHTQWQHPTYSGRVGYRPREEWNFGFSASSGSYLLHSATPTLASGTDLDDYREVVIGQDISYAWHHLQLWAELFETRFDIPRVGRARTFAYYVEARYKFTPQFSGAVRWNEQLFGTIPLGDGRNVRWGRNTWRVDVAPTYRFTPHLELKLQYSLQHAPLSGQKYSRLFASQLVLRF